MRPPEVCPNCGADVPRNARACPECGSDHETGWADDAYASKLDLPDAEFNYDEFVAKEFGKPNPVPEGIPKFWWAVAVILLVAIILWFVL
jgi:hypothetical protein